MTYNLRSIQTVSTVSLWKLCCLTYIDIALHVVSHRREQFAKLIWNTDLFLSRVMLYILKARFVIVRRRSIPVSSGNLRLKSKIGTHQLSARHRERPAKTSRCLSCCQLFQEIALCREILLLHKRFPGRSNRRLTCSTSNACVRYTLRNNEIHYLLLRHPQLYTIFHDVYLHTWEKSPRYRLITITVTMTFAIRIFFNVTIRFCNTNLCSVCTVSAYE